MDRNASLEQIADHFERRSKALEKVSVTDKERRNVQIMQGVWTDAAAYIRQYITRDD